MLKLGKKNTKNISAESSWSAYLLNQISTAFLFHILRKIRRLGGNDHLLAWHCVLQTRRSPWLFQQSNAAEEMAISLAKCLHTAHHKRTLLRIVFGWRSSATFRCRRAGGTLAAQIFVAAIRTLVTVDRVVVQTVAGAAAAIIESSHSIFDRFSVMAKAFAYIWEGGGIFIATLSFPSCDLDQCVDVYFREISPQWTLWRYVGNVDLHGK